MKWRYFLFTAARAPGKILLGIFTWTCLCYVSLKIISVRNVLFLFTTRLNTSLSQNIQTPQILNIPENVLDIELQVEKSSSLNKKQLLVLVNNSNLPLAYWSDNEFRHTGDKSCVKFPSLYELDFDNIYWQRLQTSNGTFYLYGAYYDNRWRVGSVPVIRILGMIDRIEPLPTVCQLWYDKKKTVAFSQATYKYVWSSKWGNYQNGILQPYVISCKVPPKESAGQVPTSVSLVENRCDKPTTNLRVLNNRPKTKEDFAVCVKGLDFLYEDLSARLVEWIELLNILGAKKIFLYLFDVHPNITKVLNYYQEKGLVDLTPITLPGNQPNLPGFRHWYLKTKVTHKRQNELIPYNDCLYRNLYSYEYIVLLDIDEIIMPVKSDNWSDLMKKVVRLAWTGNDYTPASYSVRHVYFFDNFLDRHDLHLESSEQHIPKYLHMLQHVYRSKHFTRPTYFVKCFHDTDRVISLHNHFPRSCFGFCTTYSISTTLAQLQHYRKECPFYLENLCKIDYLKYTLKDTIIWRFKDVIIKRATRTLSKLGFFS